MTRLDDPRADRRTMLAAFGLMFGPAVGLGLARFAYALVLPAMRTDLRWSFATAGALNTANAAGYLIGALSAAGAARRFGERRVFLGGLAVTGLAVLASAGTEMVPVLLGLRLIAGAAGALSFVVGGGLISQAGREASPKRATLLLGVYFTGGGVGIIASGLLVPAALTWGGWRFAWIVLGMLSLLALAIATPAARSLPETGNLTVPGDRQRAPLRPLAALLTCYGLFGAGYIAYMTFIIAVFKEGGATSAEVTAFWVVLGVAAAVSAFVWSPVLAGLRPGAGAALVLAILTTGALLPLVWPDFAGFFVSGVLFGGTFLTVVTAVTSAPRRSLPPTRWTAAIAALTTAFATGQCIGPVLAGVLSDASGGVRLGLVIGAVLLALAGLTALLHDRSVSA